MRTVYSIEQFNVVHNEIHFSLNETKQLSQLQSTGQVLADSEKEAFLYVIDENDTYNYLSFSKSIWAQLLHIIVSDQKAFLKVEDGVLELTDFAEALKGLLYNIEGNSNYGEAFVQAVENSFAEFLAK